MTKQMAHRLVHGLADKPAAVSAVRGLLRVILRLPQPLTTLMASLMASRLDADGARRRSPLDGRHLDTQLALALALNDSLGPAPIYHDDDIARARLIAAHALSVFDAPPRPMAQVRDLDAGGVPVRVYRPGGARPRGPLLVFYHGGGGVIGSIDSYDPVCRLLAHETGFALASVGYRLAPEHKFPAAVDDAWTAFAWLHAHADRLDVDPARMAVAGDSLGGNLAAVVCHLARERARARPANRMPAPALQVLVYPIVDATLSSRSHRLFARGYLLERALMDWFRGHYFADWDHVWDLRASPVHAVDLAALPPALIVTAGFDPLRDDGALYARRLARAGVPVRYRCHGGLIHGFITLTGTIDAARRAVSQMTADIREALQ